MSLRHILLGSVLILGCSFPLYAQDTMPQPQAEHALRMRQAEEQRRAQFLQGQAYTGETPTYRMPYEPKAPERPAVDPLSSFFHHWERNRPVYISCKTKTAYSNGAYRTYTDCY